MPGNGGAERSLFEQAAMVNTSTAKKMRCLVIALEYKQNGGSTQARTRRSVVNNHRLGIANPAGVPVVIRAAERAEVGGVG